MSFPVFSLSKNLFFDRLTEVKEAGKTNKPNPSAYIGTVGFGLCSKSKCLAQQALYTTSIKNQRFFPPSPPGEGFLNNILVIFRVLTFGGFFDTLKIHRSAVDLFIT